MGSIRMRVLKICDRYPKSIFIAATSGRDHFWPGPGRFLLDAGSGPIQYPEYLTYSDGYRYRVCVDISAVALVEARRRIGKQGLFVVADVSALPFAIVMFLKA